MPNLASIFKSEIARIARREVRADTATLKKSITTHRSEIARLKRRAQELERKVRALEKVGSKAAPEASTDAGPRRFSAKGLASQRKRLGLSAAECGLLVGASAQSIYNWESGTTRPSARHMGPLAALRSMGKRSAAARLESIGK